MCLNIFDLYKLYQVTVVFTRIEIWWLCSLVSLTLLTTGCVDTVPFTGNDNLNKQLFVECELKNTGKTEAFISHPVNLGESGIRFEPVKADEVVLTVAEMNKDIVYPFVFDNLVRRFSINHDSFQLIAGRNYILKAYMKGSNSELYSMIEMPGRFLYDSIVCSGVTFEKTGSGQIQTTASVKLYCNTNRVLSDQYLHFAISDAATGKDIPFSMAGNQQDFFMLSHRPGMLWYANKFENRDFIEFSIQVTGNEPLESVLLHAKNTTKSYYDYQKFISNAPSSPGPSSNPAIAGFNINSDAGYGSFSASYQENIRILLK